MLANGKGGSPFLSGTIVRSEGQYKKSELPQ